ncbi:MAG: hypothetical protein ACLUKP_10915 [Thomasclavelia ramosa]
MKLVIAEKPSVGKEIADVIGATKMVNLLSVAVILNVNMFKGTKRMKVGKLGNYVHNVAVS